MPDEKTAFALAGLGGFNAHGAGFLAAARDYEIVPELITATSGQITVLADWLQNKDLEKALVSRGLEHNVFAQLSVAVCGDPGVFRPAYPEAFARWWLPGLRDERPLEAFLDRVAPAQLYVPSRDPAQFATMAQVFNNCADIGIVFNAYDFRTGEAVLFGNERAKGLWPTEKSIPVAAPASAIRRQGSAELALQQITAEAVESALWLSLYGFGNTPIPHLIDGAYLRACIVSALHIFDRIFVARPLSQGWPGEGPRNWFEVQDWQTEMWFSAGYKAEIDTLMQINELVEANALTVQKGGVDRNRSKKARGVLQFFHRAQTGLRRRLQSSGNGL